MELSYSPSGTSGYDVRLIGDDGECVHVEASANAETAEVEQKVTGKPGFADNATLVRHVEAFGSHEFSTRRLRSPEKRESHRRQADHHERAAESLAGLIPYAGGEVRQGWCSACLRLSSHRAVDRRRGVTGAYLCDACGAATTRCFGTRCQHMAALGDRVGRTPRYCAAHRHDIPGFDKLSTQFRSFEDVDNWRSFDQPNLARRTKLTAGLVLGLSVVAPAAAVAAPAVGGAIGTFTGLSGAAATSHGLALLGGGSLAAGGLGMAGGATVVTAVGAGLGGAAGASVVAAYAGADDSFRLEKLKDGDGPVVLFASGFLSQNKESWDGWESILSQCYPNSAVYRVHWGAKELRALAYFLGGEAVRRLGAKAMRVAAAKAAKAGVSKLGPLSALPMVKGVLANPWSTARTRAEMTGAVLADLVARAEVGEVVLAGHSLGASVMFHALRALGTLDGPPRVQDAHLLGAAVSRGEDCGALDVAVSGHVVNYWAKQDAVLAKAYRAVSLNKHAIGQVGIGSKFARVKDRNVSRSVPDHFAYTTKVRLQ